MNHEELIEKYLSNRLSANEKASVDARLQSDADFRSSFEFYQNLQAAARAHEKKELKDRLQQLETNHSSVATAPKAKTRRLVTLAIAASVLLAFWIISQWGKATYQSSPEKLYVENFETYPNSYAPVVRGSEQLSNEQMAFAFYESGQYEEVIPKFQELLKVQSIPEIQFYLGLAEMEMGQFESAEKNLSESVLKTNKYFPQAIWYRALVRIQLGKIKAAKVDLQTLIEESDFKTDQAILLQDLLE